MTRMNLASNLAAAPPPPAPWPDVYSQVLPVHDLAAVTLGEGWALRAAYGNPIVSGSLQPYVI